MTFFPRKLTFRSSAISCLDDCTLKQSSDGAASIPQRHCMSIPDHHPYPFDQTYGFSLATLRAIRPPASWPGFNAFWQARYDRALGLDTAARLSAGGAGDAGWRIIGRTFAAWASALLWFVTTPFA